MDWSGEFTQYTGGASIRLSIVNRSEHQLAHLTAHDTVPVREAGHRTRPHLLVTRVSDMGSWPVSCSTAWREDTAPKMR